jgi:two-component system, NtrC family, C4-dicarboxylate transport sensor histidine kinase DctB
MSAPAMQAIVSSPHFEEILIRADRSAVMSTLARGMAHDLRGPLQTLTLMVDPHADLLSGPESGRIRGAVSSAVQHLTDTISRFSQVYAPIDTEPVPLILNELLDCVLELQSYQRGLPMAEVTLDVPAGLPPVRGVESHLRHLLLSLVVNAKQALAGRTEGHILLAAEQHGPSIHLSVEDDGPGLPPDERARVFEAFQTSREGSLGIGLTVVRWLIERQGGQVSLEAGRLGGVRAVVVLPAWRRR